MERGKIRNKQLAEQIRDFTGLKFGNITPTDIDGLIEYKNKYFIFIETKYKDCEMPEGQSLALTRLCDSLNKPSILFITEHDHIYSEPIDFANTIVRDIYIDGKFIKPKNGNLKLRDAIEYYLFKRNNNKNG